MNLKIALGRNIPLLPCTMLGLRNYFEKVILQVLLIKMPHIRRLVFFSLSVELVSTEIYLLMFYYCMQ